MRHEYYLKPIQVKLLPDCSPNWVKVYRYAKLMEAGVEFPPVKIYFDAFQNRWLYNDGRHRTMAAKLTGLPLKVRSAKRMGDDSKRNVNL